MRLDITKLVLLVLFFLISVVFIPTASLRATFIIVFSIAIYSLIKFTNKLE